MNAWAATTDIAVRFRGFKKAFGPKVVHRDVSFDVRRGECLGLLGGSGAGKSVILRSLVGLEKPDAGEVWVENENISRYSEQSLIEIRRKVAYVFQNGALFDSMSVFDNLAYALREHTQLTSEQIRKRVLDTLKEFGLAGNEKLFPSNLSGGMQKRVGLARSIILQPSIVLYDEPTAGLDPYNTRRICDMMLRLKSKGATAIFVTHDMPAAFSVCDRIAVLKDGKIHAIGTREEIERQDPWVAKFIQGEEL
ncbi:MAG TPA: ATP-binding cassette domain-containing protein [Pseudobdellovibrionaceae bacterium]|nr:ATP-binding cassette domain-containing protein [Pseudobdellovibrionaceae bacterium]